jgi:hypothetical protein
MYRSHVAVYGPSKPSNWLPTEAWLFPTASMVGSGEKLGTDPRMHRNVSRRAPIRCKNTTSV